MDHYTKSILKNQNQTEVKVCIAEKPSVARDIARILGASKREDGFFEGNGYCVTWTFGHLCSLKDPEEYTPVWKKWALSTLPMLPPRFGIKVMNDRGVKKQFNTIKKLLSQADEVINCGDAGQEGELIQRWVMSLADNKAPVKRLWISSLTDEALREGFKNLQPESKFNNLYHAGLSRAIGDWVLGLNATRLYSLKYSNGAGVLSVGRVQTPTLALVVQRQREIENFVPEKYWELDTLYSGVNFHAVKLRFNNATEAQTVASRIAPLPLTITAVEKKKAKEAPPRLFDLTSLQVECNKLWGWSADATLKRIQSLYEKKVTTYPRVDTTYLSDDIYPRVPDILKKMTPYAPLTGNLLSSKLPKTKRVFDNSKVTDHHAIIPTGVSPKVLEGEERQLYHLIALRFIAAFYPDCTYLQTTVDAKVDNINFRANGKIIIDAGWRNVIKKEENKKENDPDEESADLPDFNIGESGPHKPRIVEKNTQPPKLYTEGTLLRAMETAGKTVDDEELREALKVNGIGRPSTRAATIETLFKRKYIERKRKSIQATEAGIKLIDTIKNELLKSAKLTGLWENKLRGIEAGTYDAQTFVNEIKRMVSDVVNEVLADNSYIKIETGTSKKAKAEAKAAKAKEKEENASKTKRRPAIKDYSEINCPICGKGHILVGNKAFGCSRYMEGCKFIMPFSEIPKETKPGMLRTKLEKKYGKKQSE